MPACPLISLAKLKPKTQCMKCFYLESLGVFITFCDSACFSCLCRFYCAYFYYAPRKISGEHIVAALSVHLSLRPSHSCPSHNFVIWSRISKLFYRNDYHIETMCRARNIWVATLKVKVTAWPCSKIVSGP